MQWANNDPSSNGPADVEADDPVVPVTIEVRLNDASAVEPSAVRKAVEKCLEGKTLWYVSGPLDIGQAADPLLGEHVAGIHLTDVVPELQSRYGALMAWQYAPSVHVYQLCHDGPADDDEGEEGVPSYREWALPAAEFEGLWDSLYYDSGIQRQLIQYASSSLLFSSLGVSATQVAWNKLVLLHGPPGTGKTSLCKALAQKLMVRFGHKYAQGQLVEVNAHSLFSKWFSESGKLVSKLFSKITELVEDEDTLVFVLIDEVESLTAARKAAVTGSEPSDAIRAVNALLTQLDALQAAPNVLLLTTSNITGAIDLAFVDRADIKAYIGPPSERARYEILRSTLQELARAGVVTVPRGAQLVPYLELLPDGGGADAMDDEAAATARAQSMALSQALAHAAASCDGFSGRSLRKLPFLAHAAADNLPTPCTCARFIQELQAAAAREKADRLQLAAG